MSTDSSSADEKTCNYTFDLPYRILYADYQTHESWDLLISVTQHHGGPTRDFRILQTPERLCMGWVGATGSVPVTSELELVSRQAVLDVMPNGWGFTWHMLINLAAIWCQTGKERAATAREGTTSFARTLRELWPVQAGVPRLEVCDMDAQERQTLLEWLVATEEKTQTLRDALMEDLMRAYRAHAPKEEPKPCGSGTAADPGAHSGPRTEDDDPYSEGDYVDDNDIPTDS